MTRPTRTQFQVCDIRGGTTAGSAGDRETALWAAAVLELSRADQNAVADAYRRGYVS